MTIESLSDPEREVVSQIEKLIHELHKLGNDEEDGVLVTGISWVLSFDINALDENSKLKTANYFFSGSQAKSTTIGLIEMAKDFVMTEYD